MLPFWQLEFRLYRGDTGVRRGRANSALVQHSNTPTLRCPNPKFEDEDDDENENDDETPGELFRTGWWKGVAQV